MMGKFKQAFLCAFMAAGVLPVLAFAQLPPDASLWRDANGNPVLNPDGSQVVPVVAYNPSTGLMTVDTRGLNGTVQTKTGTAIGGDDVGLILVLIEGPPPLDFLLGNPPSDPPEFRGTDGIGTGWESIYFNGKAQILGQTILDEYLLPIGITELAVYEKGLRESDFPSVELGINFFPFQPGASLFGGVQIPEPAGMGLFGTALVSLVVVGRRRFSRSRHMNVGASTRASNRGP